MLLQDILSSLAASQSDNTDVPYSFLWSLYFDGHPVPSFTTFKSYLRYRDNLKAQRLKHREEGPSNCKSFCVM